MKKHKIKTGGRQTGKTKQLFENIEKLRKEKGIIIKPIAKKIK